MRILVLVTTIVTAVASIPMLIMGAPCYRVQVYQDAEFCVFSERVCSGRVDGACPTKGESAVAACAPQYASFDQDAATCLAPEDAVCVQDLTSLEYLCAFSSSASISNTTKTASALRMALVPSVSSTHRISDATLNVLVGGAVALVVAASVALAHRPRLRGRPSTPAPTLPPVTPRHVDASETVYVRL